MCLRVCFTNFYLYREYGMEMEKYFFLTIRNAKKVYAEANELRKRYETTINGHKIRSAHILKHYKKKALKYHLWKLQVFLMMPKR